MPLGSYQVAVPEGWDAKRPLGLLLFFHGYGSSGESPLKNPALLQQAAARGLLLVAPNGIPGRPEGPTSWAHVGSPSQARDELAFVDQVLADVERQWPLDPERRFVSGFSQGGSMAWDLACYRAEDFTGFAPIAGAFWIPLPPDCPSGPVALRHVHGTADGVVPLAGRPIGSRWRQGDVLEAMAIRRAANTCPAEPDERAVQGRLTCEIWSACGSGEPVALCLHDGGHAFRAEWIGQAIDWLEGR
ncbi:MAG: PHB depolymerase family esterase [Rhodospirillales bacterium]